MPIVGTAGHVDHGKSALVRALTGTDPDRWAEEKQRGLPIDLGFAWTRLGAHDVGFVDVPGHERFVKNMLAGVGALDCAILVVAADSGWMPQTEEHASVLDLLDVRRGVIAVTRIDLVDEDTRDLAVLEIIDEVAATTLDGWPIIPVSSRTGEGLDVLGREIASALDDARPPGPGPFRMWVDRSFTIAGAGRVVTGTVVSGSVAVGDELVIAPGSEPVRVRGLQHHGGPVESATTGMRTAINITGEARAVDRGDAVVTAGTTTVTSRILVSLRPTRALETIPDRGAFHVHVGTASRPARMRRLAREGHAVSYLVTFDDPIPACCGDRVIVRDSGRRAVVGGGRILDPLPADRPDHEAIDVMVEAIDRDRDALADALVTAHGALPLDVVRAATGGGVPDAGVRAGSVQVSVAEAARVHDLVTEAAAIHHDNHPSRPGVPKGELASRLDVPVSVIEAVVGAGTDIEEVEGVVRLTGFNHGISPDTERRWSAARHELEASFDVPRLSSLDLGSELIHFLVRRGDLVRVGDDVAFTDTQAQEIMERVAELPDDFSVSQFKDHFGMARRQAIPTLEWLDAIGRTRRHGDGREVR
jgi:selenocysteine-specific elongation factor